MILKEKECITQLLNFAFNRLPLPQEKYYLLEDVLFNSFVWHFSNKRKWDKESIKDNAIIYEVNLINETLNGTPDNKLINSYYKQFNEYLGYNIFPYNNYLKKTTEKQLKFAKSLRKWYHRFFVQSLIYIGDFVIFIIIKPFEVITNVSQKKKVKKATVYFNDILRGTTDNKSNAFKPFYYALKRFKEYLENPNGFDYRIKTNQSMEKVSEYFLQLNQINNDEKEFRGKNIMPHDDIKYFLKANFIGFEPREKPMKFSPYCSQAALRYFIYEFYRKEKQLNNKINQKTYSNLLHENFTQFDGVDPTETTEKAFSRRSKYLYINKK